MCVSKYSIEFKKGLRWFKEFDKLNNFFLQITNFHKYYKLIISLNC